jgi:uncharacterized membrane protein YjfL (UPF0719 family)
VLPAISIYAGEIIEFWRKLLLSSAIIFFRPGSTIQVLMGCIICVLFLFLVSTFKPYRELEDDHTNSIAFLCLTFTLMLGMALRLHQYEASSASDLEVAAFSWILFLVNIALMVYSACTIMMETFDECQAQKESADTVVELAAVRPQNNTQTEAAPVVVDEGAAVQTLNGRPQIVQTRGFQ